MFKLLYGCVKVSPEFCKVMTNYPEVKVIADLNKLYGLAMNYTILRQAGKQLLDINQILK